MFIYHVSCPCFHLSPAPPQEEEMYLCESGKVVEV